MDWGFLSFLAEPWFVIPWYAIGIAGFFQVVYDVVRYNTPLKTAMKWGWPVIVLFFSVIGLALYYGTARAPGIAAKPERLRKKAHVEYEKNMFRRVNGAVIHCVAGDGLGIMTGMVIARATGMSFWQEFWFEYLIGFLFGLFVFQFRSMLMMTDSKAMALAMAFRAEFMSMLTVMAGMGAVMAYITPMTVAEQPKPLTYAFWGFGMFGLLLGYVFTWPMNYLMVKIGWKHGMGDMKTARKREVETPGARAWAYATMAVLGIAALIFPAWLMEARDGTPIRPPVAAVPQAGIHTELGEGLRETLEAGLRYFENGRRTRAVHAVDAAHRAAVVIDNATPDDGFSRVLRDIEATRHELHMGREHAARVHLSMALETVRHAGVPATAEPDRLERLAGATVLNAHGVEIGEIVDIRAGRAVMALGGARNVGGFLDFRPERTVEVPVASLAAGPARIIGRQLVVVPVSGG